MSDDQQEAAAARPRTRIQRENEERILDAALDVFTRDGFRGATVAEIAEAAGMTKQNLLYYFPRKPDIYRAVLERTLARWLDPLRALDARGDPMEELKRYIRQKLDLSRRWPADSRLYAGEMLRGAPYLADVLEGPLKAIVEEKVRVIEGWIVAGRIAPVDPHHLIFALWAMTQHYADFEVQVRTLLDGNSGNDPYAAAERTILQLVERGLRVD